MKDVGQEFKKLINKTLEKVGACSNCGGTVYEWKNKRTDGKDRSKPVCMNCGSEEIALQEDRQTERIYNQSLKNRNMQFFKSGSVVPNKSLFDKTFDNFQVDSEEANKVVNMADQFVDEILADRNTHMIFSGKSGSGKSHIAMATLQEVMKRSEHSKKCLFINYRELLEMLKNSINEPEMQKVIRGSLMKDIKTTDLVVLDDLGVELGGSNANNSTAYNNDSLHAILEAREDKPLIVTTNLTSKEISSAYGERVMSRILNNARGYMMAFKDTPDKRIKGA